MPDLLADDENVKAMRETARQVGLTQLLIDILRSPPTMATVDIDRLNRALDLLSGPSACPNTFAIVAVRAADVQTQRVCLPLD